MLRAAFWLVILTLVPWYPVHCGTPHHHNRTIRLVPLNAFAFMR